MNQRNRGAKMIVGLIVVLLGLLLLQSVMTPASAQTILLGVIAGLVAMLVMQPLSSKAGDTLEYKLMPAGSLNQSMLDEFGKDGWRLVCAGQDGTGYIFVR